MSVDLLGRERWSVLYIGSLAWLPICFLPYDVETVMTRFKLTESASGSIASAFLLLLATIVYLLSSRILSVNKRRASQFATMVAIASTVALLLTHSLTFYLIFKLLFSGAIAVLVACTYGLANHYRHPESVFAQVASFMAVLYGLAMWLIPLSLQRWGEHGVEVVQLALVGLGLLAAAGMPVAQYARELASMMTAPKQKIPVSARWILLAVFILFVSQTAVMGFASSAAHERGISDDLLGIVLMGGFLAQLPAASLTTWLGRRGESLRPIIGGLIVLFAAGIGMYVSHSPLVFIVAAALISGAAAVANPFMLAYLVRADETGRSAALAGSATNFGSAIGPALAGFVAADLGGLSQIGWLNTALIVVCLLAVTVIHRRDRLSMDMAV